MRTKGIETSAPYPIHRKQGVVSMLLGNVFTKLDEMREIAVSNICEKDEEGATPSAVYRKLEFRKTESREEFGYPIPLFVLNRKKRKYCNERSVN